MRHVGCETQGPEKKKTWSNTQTWSNIHLNKRLHFQFCFGTIVKRGHILILLNLVWVKCYYFTSIFEIYCTLQFTSLKGHHIVSKIVVLISTYSILFVFWFSFCSNNNFFFSCSFGGGGGGSRGGGRGGFGGGSFRGGGGGFSGKKDKLNNNPGQYLRKPKWDLDAMPKFKKDFYREHPNVQNRSMVRIHVVEHFTFGVSVTDVWHPEQIHQMSVENTADWLTNTSSSTLLTSVNCI